MASGLSGNFSIRSMYPPDVLDKHAGTVTAPIPPEVIPPGYDQCGGFTRLHAGQPGSLNFLEIISPASTQNCVGLTLVGFEDKQVGFPVRFFQEPIPVSYYVKDGRLYKGWPAISPALPPSPPPALPPSPSPPQLPAPSYPLDTSQFCSAIGPYRSCDSPETVRRRLQEENEGSDKQIFWEAWASFTGDA